MLILSLPTPSGTHHPFAGNESQVEKEETKKIKEEEKKDEREVQCAPFAPP